MPERLKSYFVNATLSDSSWTSLISLGFPSKVFSVEVRNSSGSMAIRDNETDKEDTYIQNEIYKRYAAPPNVHDISNLEIQGTGGDDIIGEYEI